MMERKFIAQKTKEFYIKKYIESTLNKVGISKIKLKKIPLGEKIIVDTSRPSLIVGSKGANIKELTRVLKKEFKLENPQIEINEVKNFFLDANIVAERIAGSLERFGSARFKGVGHKMLANVISAGALGVEIIISGKLPSSRARNWRFYQGYLKKCGDVSISGVKRAQSVALLKSGIIGIKVAIMPPDLVLPDHVEILQETEQVIEEIKSTEEEVTKKEEKKETATKKTSKKKTSTKKKAKKEEAAPVEEVTEKVEVVKEEKQEETAPVKEEIQDQKITEETETVPVEKESKEETQEENKEEPVSADSSESEQPKDEVKEQ